MLLWNASILRCLMNNYKVYDFLIKLSGVLAKTVTSMIYIKAVYIDLGKRNITHIIKINVQLFSYTLVLYLASFWKFLYAICNMIPPNCGHIRMNWYLRHKYLTADWWKQIVPISHEIDRYLIYVRVIKANK